MGFGSSPMGASSYGFGSTDSVLPSVKRILLKPDGTQGTAALIDPRTGDYVVDEHGNKVGCDVVQQKVFIALVTALGSSAVQSVGVALPTGTIVPALAQRNEQAVRAALKSMIDAREVELLSVTTKAITTTGRGIEVQWRALPGGTSQSTFI